MTTDKKNKEYLENFGKNLKHLRRQKNLSQQQLAIKLRVNETTYQKWEQGKVFPERLDLLHELTAILEATLHDMLFVDIATLKNAA